jgi:tetratricopeptide (TPR) repeat protein
MRMTASEITPATVPAVWGNVPQRNKNFTGREEILIRLRDSAARQVTAVLPSEPLPHALQGLGGVGKTAVAIEYAHRFRSEYDLIWWIPADQPALVRSSLAALAGRLGLEAASAIGIEGAATAVLDALRRGEPYNRWLLVFDNADQPEELQDILPRGPGDILITSRNHRWQAVIDTVPLDVFTRPESTEFLIKRVPKGLSDEDANRLAEELGDLPLALEQAGAVQSETGMSAAEYLRLLGDEFSQITQEGKPPEYPRPMTATWKISIAALRSQLPQAQELLRLCAFFGPDPIPRDLFQQGGGRGTGSQVSELMTHPILLARAIRELGRFALVKIEGRTIQVHRLIQALIRDELASDEQAAYRHEVHMILAGTNLPAPNDQAVWPRYNELIAHISSPVTDLPDCQDPAVRSFVMKVMRYLYVSGDLASCRSYAERFIGQWQQVSGPDNEYVLDAQRFLGNTLWQLGRYSESSKLIEETLNRTRRVLGEENPLTPALQNSLGANLRARGEFAQALVLDVDNLALHERVFGATEAQTLRAMNSLAMDYTLNGRYRESRDLNESVFVLQAHADGVSEYETLSWWTNLAWAVRMAGDYTEARDVSEDALDYGTEKLGPEHFATLQTARCLSIALRFIPATQERALETAHDVLDANRRILGAAHPDTLAAEINLANVLRIVGQTAEALELAEVTASVYPNVYGAEHPFSYGCRGNLALMRRMTGDSAGARTLNESVLTGLDGKLTRDHDYSLVVAVNLASDYAVLGDVSLACSLGKDSLTRLRPLLGEDHPFTLGCAANLAADLRANGEGDEASTLLTDTLERYERTVGSDHPDALAAAAGRRLDFDFDPAQL